ncbi:hypothetical protein ACEN2J_00520 [Pseudorhodobacter sp. W20_MBD10_FR17]|uniref:hypothetical protein n=1 Tax=Pseudorhodobacter sp. W20_MBD10_FR17 TaxID=3240266 RepID=UPI003F961D24
MNIDSIIANITKSSTKALLGQRARISAKLGADSAHQNTQSILDAVDNELQRRFPTPRDGWSTGTQGDPRYFRTGGTICALVVRMETHGHAKGSYLVEVNGSALDETPRHIAQARILAEAKLGLVAHN